MQIILLISCPDQPGIVAQYSGILFRTNANIISLEEHTETGWFFMRIHADCDNLNLGWEDLKKELEGLSSKLGARLGIYDSMVPVRIALLVSTKAACLQELLIRQQTGQLKCEIPLIISNQQKLSGLAGQYNIPFYYVPYEGEDNSKAEQQILGHIEKFNIDAIVLARFMKVLSANFVDQFHERIINIHHGFLPAFKGSKPYHQAWDHGVKVIGATAHYVTAELDAGAIIAQEVLPVTHQYSAKDMVQVGQDIERRVLLNANTAFLQHRIILHNQRAIVFR